MSVRAAPPDSGLAVILPVPGELATQLALTKVDGATPADEMHLTLAYLGKVGDLPDGAAAIMEAVVAEVAAEHPAVSGVISGWGRFNASATSDGKDVVHLSFDSAGLADLRADLVRRLGEAGLSVRREHGFDPHITLAYVPAGRPVQLEVDSFPLELREIHATAWSPMFRLGTPFHLTGAPRGVGKVEIDALRTSEDVHRLSDADLLQLHQRLHQMYAAAQAAGRATEYPWVNVHVWAVEEMGQRGMAHRPQDNLDQQTERLTKAADAPALAGWLQARAAAASEAVVVPAYISVVGSAVTEADPGDVDVLVRDSYEATSRGWRESLHLLARKALDPGKLGKRLHVVCNPHGPHLAKGQGYMPLYDLVLRPRAPELLSKATLTTQDITPPIGGGLLAPQQGLPPAGRTRAGKPFWLPSAVPEEEKERLAKAFPNGVPEAGVHVHNLERESGRTKEDGLHPHLFVLPDGQLLWTEEDGGHVHEMAADADATGLGGAHTHQVRLADGQMLTTSMDGEHSHQLQAWSSAFDGVHVHVLELPDGTLVRNLLPGEYWEHMGSPAQADVPAAPPASVLAQPAMAKAESERATGPEADRARAAGMVYDDAQDRWVWPHQVLAKGRGAVCAFCPGLARYTYTWRDGGGRMLVCGPHRDMAHQVTRWFQAATTEYEWPEKDELPSTVPDPEEEAERQAPGPGAGAGVPAFGEHLGVTMSKAVEPPGEGGETVGEAALRHWEEGWQEAMPVSGDWLPFVLHAHWRGLSEEEAKMGMDALLKTDHSVHFDLRLGTDRFQGWWGFTLFAGTTADNRPTLRVEQLQKDPAETIQAAPKQFGPKPWLTVGRPDPLIVEPGGVGGTTQAWSKFFAIDHGRWRLGYARQHAVEMEIDGGILKGRHVLQYAPGAGRERIWLLTRPEEQAPFAASHDLADVVRDVKDKGQQWLFWPNDATDLGDGMRQLDVRKLDPDTLEAKQATRKHQAAGALRIIKAERERRYTLSVAYPANQIDAHKDFATADQVEETAWEYAKGDRRIGLMHRRGTDGAGTVVESYIYRGPDWRVGNQVVKAGDWLLGVIWTEAAWQLIKAGTYTGLSIQGYARKRQARANGPAAGAT